MQQALVIQLVLAVIAFAGGFFASRIVGPGLANLSLRSLYENHPYWFDQAPSHTPDRKWLDLACGLVFAVAAYVAFETVNNSSLYVIVIGYVMAFACSALVRIDLDAFFLPDNITLPLLWLFLMLSLLNGNPIKPADAILGAAVGFLAPWAINKAFLMVSGENGMGGGDFKLLAAMGAAMGPKAAIGILCVAAILGSIAQIKSGFSKTKMIPFGPFLIVAAAAAFAVWPIARAKGLF